MSTYLKQGKVKLQWAAGRLYKFWLGLKRFLQKQFNRNLYTKILFTNIIAFAIVLIVLVVFSNFMAKQAIYSQIQQELLREAKRINFALLAREDHGWNLPPDQRTSSQIQAQQELLQYLSDIYDVKITIFDTQGKLMAISAEQEMVPGSTIEGKYLKLFEKGSIATLQTVEQDTGQPVFAAVVPMGDNEEILRCGILVEASSSSLNLGLSKMRLYMMSGGMVLLLLILFISVYLAGCISRPISRLTASVTEISRGNYVLRDEEHPLEEISNLGGQIDQLAERQQKIQGERSRMEEERTRLFAEISHELRTPLTSVQGFVEAIRDGIVQDDALREQYLDIIYTQTVHINRLVDDILELSRLESGNITVEKLPVDLNALARGVAMSMEPVAERVNTSISVEIKSEKAVILGDADRLEQVIRNLLKNAIRATDNGAIRVEVEVRQDKVVLCIEDNGAGIAPEDLSRIWERFYRIKNQREEHMGERGSGLGLVIVKKLVQLQNGGIEVASQLGKGTAFRISFPAFDQKP